MIKNLSFQGQYPFLWSYQDYEENWKVFTAHLRLVGGFCFILAVNMAIRAALQKKKFILKNKIFLLTWHVINNLAENLTDLSGHLTKFVKSVGLHIHPVGN